MYDDIEVKLLSDKRGQRYNIVIYGASFRNDLSPVNPYSITILSRTRYIYILYSYGTDTLT